MNLKWKVNDLDCFSHAVGESEIAYFYDYICKNLSAYILIKRILKLHLQVSTHHIKLMSVYLMFFFAVG